MSFMVSFSSRGEWVAELRQAHARMEVDDQLPLRVTLMWETDAKVPIIQRVSVVAAFVARGVLIELRVYCGDELAGCAGEGPGDVRLKADGLREEIEREARQLGLEVRHGKYLLAQK